MAASAIAYAHACCHGQMETITYRGRRIELATFQVGRGYFWQFQIDDGPVTICEDAPLSTAVMARDEGSTQAKWTIDQMP